MDSNNSHQKVESNLPLKPSILRQKKRILQTRQSMESNQPKIIQKFKHMKTQQNIKDPLQEQFQGTIDNSNARLLSGEKRRTSFATTTSFEQTTARSRYSLMPSTKSKASLPADSEIRRQLDQKLANIHKILSQRQLSFDLSNNRINSSERLRGEDLDQKLVHRYLELIYQDYDIPKLEECSQFILNDQYEQKYKFLRTRPIQAIKQEFSRKPVQKQIVSSFKSNRRAMQLKKMFIKQMTTSSKTQKKFRELSQPRMKPFKQNVISSKEDLSTISNMHAGNGETPENYRYCLACEKKIQSFIDEAHSKQKCFKSLSEMTMVQLKQNLIKIILKVKAEGEEIYNQMFANKGQEHLMKKILKYRDQTKKCFGIIQNKLNSKIDNLNVRNMLKSNLKEVTQLFGDRWEKLQESIRKLQWFTFMIIRLQEKQDQLQDRHSGPRLSLR